jgi:hypothetical protein
MTTKNKGINKAKLTKQYPQVAKIVDTILEENKNDNYWFYVNYCGKYKDKNGAARAVSMGSIFDLLTNYGYKIDIIVK